MQYPVKLCLPWGRQQLTWTISHYTFCKFNWIKFMHQRLLLQHVSINSIVITRQFNKLNIYVCNYSAKLCQPFWKTQIACMNNFIHPFCDFNWIKSRQQRLLWQLVVSTNSIKITWQFIKSNGKSLNLQCTTHKM